MTAGEIDQPAQHEHSRAAVLKQADSTGVEVSEMTVFAIPLFHQGDLVQLVYLPVPNREPPSESGKSRVPHKVMDYAQKTQVHQGVKPCSVKRAHFWAFTSLTALDVL